MQDDCITTVTTDEENKQNRAQSMSEEFDILLFFVLISKPNRQFGVSLGETQHMKSYM